MESWWQQWIDSTNVKSLNVMVGSPCLAPPLSLGIPGLGGAQEDCTRSSGAGAALIGPLLVLAEVRSRALHPARGASAHRPPRHHQQKGKDRAGLHSSSPPQWPFCSCAHRATGLIITLSLLPSKRPSRGHSLAVVPAVTPPDLSVAACQCHPQESLYNDSHPLPDALKEPLLQ